MYETLNTEQPFGHYDLELSTGDLAALSQLTILDSSNYDNFGKLEELDVESTKFLQKVATGDPERIAALITKLVAVVLTQYQQETAWVSLRSFIPTPIYKKPRWHTDGYYYSPMIGNQYKVVITLKGNPTLFTKVNPLIKDQFFSLQENNASEQINTLLANCCVESANFGQGSHFIAGSKDAAIHSEPDITEPRLFLGILPGAKEQIVQWQQNN